MNIKRAQRLLSLGIAFLTAISTFLAPEDAKAAGSAYLVSCTSSTSIVPGTLIYVGIYNYAGRNFQATFTSWCPYQIAV